MSNFGKYAVLDNVKYHLEREPDMWWVFKPPTAREEIAINRFTQGGSIKQSAAGIERNIVTNAEIALEELALTVQSSNLKGKDGKNIINTKTMSVDTIREVVRSFPKELFWELWDALGATCPGWGAVPKITDDDDDESEDSPKDSPKEKPSKEG